MPVESRAMKTLVSEPVKTYIYRSPEIRIGGKEIAPKFVSCVDLTMLRAISGERFEGVLGMDVMRGYVVTIDPDSGLFRIGERVPERVKKRAVPVPLTKATEQGIYSIQARVNGSGPIELEIDTGSNGFLSLSRKVWKEVFRDNETATAQILIAGGDGKTTTTEIGRVARVTVSTNSYTNVIARLVPNEAIPSCIGFAFFRRHVTTIDVPHHTMYLMPGKRFGTVEENDMSGLHLIKVERKIMVYSVNQGSPASNSGIRSGDEILSINGKDADRMHLQTIREILKKKERDKITMQVRRKGKTSERVFRLKKSI